MMPLERSERVEEQLDGAVVAALHSGADGTLVQRKLYALRNDEVIETPACNESITNTLTLYYNTFSIPEHRGLVQCCYKKYSEFFLKYSEYF